MEDVVVEVASSSSRDSKELPLLGWGCSISRTESDKSRFDQSMVET